MVNESTPVRIFRSGEPLLLESGQQLPGFEIAFQSWGKLNSEKNNVIWICHALTANSDAASWWPGMIGKGAVFDPEKHFIICANVLGSCYGSTYALSRHLATGKPYYYDFPAITIRDIIRGFIALRKHLGIDQIHLLIGGSLGGQQVLEWAVMEPDVFAYCVPIATNAFHSPWGIAFNESQRMAIAADDSWGKEEATAGLEGMKAARAMALLSYRNYQTYQKTQAEESEEKPTVYRAVSYQQYQGEKLAKRFDAFAYWTLSQVMDSHQLGRERGWSKSCIGSDTSGNAGHRHIFRYSFSP